MEGRDVGAFAARLRGLRDAAALTQEELAERSGLTAKAIGALERGERRRPYRHTVRALADGLGRDDGDRAVLTALIGRRRAGDGHPPNHPAPWGSEVVPAAFLGDGRPEDGRPPPTAAAGTRTSPT